MILDPLPPSASTIAHRVDILFYVVSAVTGTVAVAIAITIVWFSVKYRAGSDASRDQIPLNKAPLEIAWIAIPLALFIAAFVWSTSLFADFHTIPRDAQSIYVLGKQWMWKVEHENGRREIDQIHVPVGQPIKLLLTSQDVIHSFFVPAFRIKQDVVPGRYEEIWFTATRLGEYELYCAEFCGTEHARMRGGVIVMSQPDYAQWLENGPSSESAELRGFELMRDRGCTGCHDAHSTIHAPSLEGLFGSIEHLKDGRSIQVDENYLRDSILAPSKDIVSGYEDVMPSFKDQITEEDVVAMVEYLKKSGVARR